MLCFIKVNRNTIELAMHTSCYWVLDLLCVTIPLLIIIYDEINQTQILARFASVQKAKVTPLILLLFVADKVSSFIKHIQYNTATCDF